MLYPGENKIFWGLSSFLGFGLLEPGAPRIAGIWVLHDFVLIVLFLVLGVVVSLFIWAASSTLLSPEVVSPETVEVIWTIVPAVSLLFLAIPSLGLLYDYDVATQEDLFEIKTIGHQWYWSYDYVFSSGGVGYDSYITLRQTGLLNSLDVDQRLVVSSENPTRLLVGSSDVLHSWTLPRMGVKIDAVPGRLREIILNPLSAGLFYGQCSELCGVNHSYIPICIEAVPLAEFSLWTSLVRTS